MKNITIKTFKEQRRLRKSTPTQVIHNVASAAALMLGTYASWGHIEDRIDAQFQCDEA